MTQDGWNPQQYNKFREQRLEPLADLLALIKPVSDMKVLDLGCGTGEPTALLLERFPNAIAVGVDSSPAMLKEAEGRAGDRLRFVHGDIATWEDLSGHSLIFSHAALQWVPEHETLLPRLLNALPEGGQLAVQMPNNFHHVTHEVAREVAGSPPYRERLTVSSSYRNVLSLEKYAEILWRGGCRSQECREKVYPHVMDDVEALWQWNRGTALTPYLKALGEEAPAFEARYLARLKEELGDSRPVFFPFRRMLLWGQKG